MPGTLIGARRRAAAEHGLTLDEYEARLAAGEKWCSACKAWHPVANFPADRSRGDGLRVRCLAADRGKPRPPRRRGARAHARVWMRVYRGKLPHPNTLPCLDCGHVWNEGERRHEYDHPRGYEGDAALDIEPVCTLCHADREKARRG